MSANVRSKKYAVFLAIIGLISASLSMLVPVDIANQILTNTVKIYGVVIALSGILFFSLRNASLPDTDTLSKREREGVKSSLSRIRERSRNSIIFCFIAGIFFSITNGISSFTTPTWFAIFCATCAILVVLQINSFSHFMAVSDFKDFLKSREISAAKKKAFLDAIINDK